MININIPEVSMLRLFMKFARSMAITINELKIL